MYVILVRNEKKMNKKHFHVCQNYLSSHLLHDPSFVMSIQNALELVLLIESLSAMSHFLLLFELLTVNYLPLSFPSTASGSHCGV